MNIHEIYMFRAIECAKNTSIDCYPNPRVGCVIIDDTGQIIGQGTTAPYGGPHAEVVALNSVQNREKLAGASLYVTLEPCAHYGKTPPCSLAIIQSGIKRVYIGCTDPNPLVCSQGIHQLTEHGLEVFVGILESACLEHHKRFLTFQTKHRPYITLKWAQTLEGFMAPTHALRSKKEPFRLSSHPVNQRVHHWRSQEAAILIGVQTALDDRPQLNTRLWDGPDPIPMVFDPHGRASGSAPLWKHPSAIHIGPPIELGKQVNHWTLTQYSIDEVLKKAYEQGIISIFVEGGAYTLTKWLDSGQWDEIRVIQVDKHLEQGLLAPKLTTNPTSSEILGPDRIDYYRAVGHE